MPHPTSDLAELRSTRRRIRLQLRDAQRAERLARLAMRRTKMTDDLAMLAQVRHQHAAAQEAVEALTVELMPSNVPCMTCR